MRKFLLIATILSLASLLLQGCNIGSQDGNSAVDDYKSQEDKAEKLGESGNMPVYDNSP